MARLRLLLALGLIGVGTSFGALALSGYYGSASPPDQISVASIDSRAGAQLVRAKPRQRFVAADTQPVVSVALTPPKQKPIANPPREISKPKDKPKERPRPQQASAQWPWNLFSN